MALIVSLTKLEKMIIDWISHHSWVINVNHLKLFEPPLLEEAVIITHPVNNIPDFQLPLAKETLLDT